MQISTAVLANFRILFGLMMALSVVRFWAYGWIETQYIDPVYYFSYFDWIVHPGARGIYVLFGTVFLGALGIMLGWYYRISATLFFLSFTYIELLDKTNYLNHYYFVSLVGFLLIFLPVHRDFSLDVIRKPALYLRKIPVWTVNLVKFQLALVYVFAGLAKLNPDWLFRAMPLKLWLPAQSHVPLIGGLLNYEVTAYVFSWCGAFYDLFIVFFLMYRPTRLLAYAAVVVFHVATALLFQIGMFPYIMILATLIFFSAEAHDRVQMWIKQRINFPLPTETTFINNHTPALPLLFSWSAIRPAVLLFIIIQLLIPLRFMAYPGHLFWTEQGYRFSWRVMLMEKAGYATFTVSDQNNQRREWVDNNDYLTPQQEKMMSTQPDMILQFAHHLADVYRQRGYTDPIIKCQSRVTLNGVSSQPLVDPTVNLAAESVSWKNKTWILPFNPQFDPELPDAKKVTK